MRDYYIEPPAFGRKDGDSKPSAFEVAKQASGKLKVIKKDKKNAAPRAESPNELASGSSNQPIEDWAATLRADVKKKGEQSQVSVEEARRQVKNLWNDEKAA